jgi:hypothetical protein
MLREERDAGMFDPPPFGQFGETNVDIGSYRVRPLDRTRKGREGYERRQAEDD